jgi:hypothetical protein
LARLEAALGRPLKAAGARCQFTDRPSRECTRALTRAIPIGVPVASAARPSYVELMVLD